MTKTARQRSPVSKRTRASEAVSVVTPAPAAPDAMAALRASVTEASTSTSSSSSSSSDALAMVLRARLLERLSDARVPAGHAQALHLAGITGRAYQTTRRWIDDASPGLPDLTSFRMLCEGVDADAQWLLGLTDDKRSLREAVGAARTSGVARAAGAPTVPRDAVAIAAQDGGSTTGASAVSAALVTTGASGTDGAVAADDASRTPGTLLSENDAWLEAVFSNVGREMYGCRARRMRGDEMEPEIADGDTIFIDATVRNFDGHGTYLITCDGQELVRRLEYTVGKGLVVSCANPRYEPAVFRDAEEILAHGLRIMGRIEGVVQIRRFWRLLPGRASGD